MAGDGVYNKQYANDETFGSTNLLDRRQESGEAAVISTAGQGGPSSPFFETIGGVLYRKKLEKGCINYREVLAEDRHSSAIATFHQKRNGKLHHTLEDTYRFVAENYWWEGMYTQIRDYVLGCQICKMKNQKVNAYEEPISKTLASHSKELLDRLNSQRADGQFCDVTLILDGGVYSAHKAVLAAVSEYFQEVFLEMDSTSNQKSVIDLSGFKWDSFLPLLDFSYTSTLSLKSENLMEICAMARHLRMWSVVELCKGFQKEQGLTDKNISQTNKTSENQPSSLIKQPWTIKSQGNHTPLRNNEVYSRIEYFERPTSCFTLTSETSDPAENKSQIPEGCFTSTLNVLDDLSVESSSSCTITSMSLNKTLQQPQGIFSSPSRRLKLLDFKSPSSKSKSSLKNLSTAKSSQSLDYEKTNLLVSQNFDRTDVSGDQSNSSSLAISKCKQKLWFSPRRECKSERAVTCQESLKSPIKTEAMEEEVPSPNTAEKYKLLGVLGLQRKSLIVCGEELTGWSQKKRLRKLKVNSYCLTTQRKKSTNTLCTGNQVIDEKQSALSQVNTVSAAVFPSVNYPTKKVNLNISTTVKTEPPDIIDQVSYRVALKRRGYGWTKIKATKAKVAAGKTKLPGERKALQDIHNAEKKNTLECKTLRSYKAEGRPITGVQPKNSVLTKDHIKTENVARECYSTDSLVQNKYLSITRSHSRLVNSSRIGKLDSKKYVLEDFSTASVRILRKNSEMKNGKLNEKFTHGIGNKVIFGGGKFSACQPFQKVNVTSRGSITCKTEPLDDTKESKPWLSENKRQYLRSSTCKLEMISDLGKRERKPTQKRLEAGFLLNWHSSDNRKQGIVKSSDRDNKKNELCFRASISGINNKKRMTSVLSSRSEIARTVQKANPVILLGKNLLKFKGKSILTKKCNNYHVDQKGRRKCCMQHSVLRKMTKIQTLAHSGSKQVHTKELPKKLQKMVKLNSRQGSFIEPVKKKQTKEIKVRRSRIGSGAPLPSHTCPHCRVTFKSCDSLIMHKIRHIEGKHWPCPLCKKSFFRMRNVQNHIRTHDQLIYKCRNCLK
ncbi:uncharacterized protein si:dkey-229b18.3 isoform X1 [Erpetoichthys calabaricus]|uniref:Uncharacterized LOC114650808 n=1 Tax=Erpetoichthys calabaricus TaxID=27687 RepID=A0A8C4RJW1_ERPCA|nr:uncharacterized protein si:dkey-229b18.3 isoform X1 [Erpetoichthys calabaricus]